MASSYEQLILSRDPDAYLRFEEASGTTAAVLGSGGRTATVGSGITLGSAPSPVPGSHFSAYANASHNGSVDLSGPELSTQGSVEFWLRWVDGVAPFRDYTTSSPGWLYPYSPSDTIYGRINGVAVDTGVAKASIMDRWTHLAFTKSAGEVRFYIDGVEVGTASDVGDTAAVMPWRIGRNGIAGTQSKNYFDEVVFYTHVLTPEQIAQSFSYQPPVATYGQIHGSGLFRPLSSVSIF